MKSAVKYLWFETRKAREFIRITDDVEDFVRSSGMRERMCLVSTQRKGSLLRQCSRLPWQGGPLADPSRPSTGRKMCGFLGYCRPRPPA
ncbi:MAG: hypothetical protein ACYTKD_12650 [Planctomycetota bacterium]